MKISRKSLSLVATLVVAAFFLGCAAKKTPVLVRQGDYDSVKKYLTEYITREMKSHKVVGLSIALVDDQNLVWAQGFGYADKEKGIPADARTLYRVASISKLFTATSVMQLAEQGKVNIDQPLQTYLPEFSIQSRFPHAGPITPRNMMNHHSGLPADFLQGFATSSQVRPAAGIIPLLKESYVAAPPNFAWSYSNLAFSLLGLMVAKVSGKDFVAYTDANVFEPLHMTNSSFELKPAMQPLLSKAYHKQKADAHEYIRDTAAGNLYSNVEDLARFEMIVFADGKAGERQILKPETIKQMLSVQNANVKLDLDQGNGLNWFLYDYFDLPEEAGPVAWHGGDLIYHHTVLITLPKYKIGVIVLQNSAEGAGLAANIGGEAIRALLKAKTGIDAKAQKREPISDPAKLTEQDLQKYAGFYDSSSFGVFEIKPRRDRLSTTMMSNMLAILPGTRIDLIPHQKGEFSPVVMLFGLVPVDFAGVVSQYHPLIDISQVYLTAKEIEGGQALVANITGHKLLYALKLEPMPIPEIWMKRMGRYEVTDKGDNLIYFSDINLKVENGLAIAEMKPFIHGAGSVVKLAAKPISDTEAVIMGVGRDRGETIRFIPDRDGEILNYSGLHFRRVE